MRLPAATAAVLLSALLAATPAGLRAEPVFDANDIARTAGEAQAVDLFVRALRRIKSDYVEPMSDQQLAEIAISAMAERDRYSRYMTSDQYRSFKAENDGVMSGIGIRYEAAGERFRITESIAGSPAEKAGLRQGDVILAVDGWSVAGQPLSKVSELVKGADGTTVRLTVTRAGTANALDIVVERGTMTVPSVRSAALGSVGYVRIHRFDRQTAPGVAMAIRDLRQSIGPSLRGFVLDVRDNPGGLVRASVEVADDFLNAGVILTSSGRGDGASKVHRATPGDETGDKPLVVLVNGRSASSAEILAGALKDHGRAVLVGTKTYGKGVIQSIFPLGGGAAMKLTVARYETPAGHQIHQIGITPDVIVEAPEGLAHGSPDPSKDPQLARALKVLEAAPAAATPLAVQAAGTDTRG